MAAHQLGLVSQIGRKLPEARHCQRFALFTNWLFATVWHPLPKHCAVGTAGSTGNLGLGDGGQFELCVYCEKGYIRLDQTQASLTVRHHTGEELHYGPLPPDDRYPKFATSANLVDVVLGRAENGSPAATGARVVELLEAAYRSAAEGGQAVNVAELD